MKKLVITIDGPAGSGKTTVSKMIAERLDYKYIDTGALYRGIAFESISKNIDPLDDEALKALCETVNLNFVRENNILKLFSGDKDISDKIRTPEISMMASAVSARPVVRECLLGLQRKMGEEKCAVFEGRDMGTVVFPQADIKFFMTASIKARALRRFKEFKDTNPQTLEEVEEDIRIRDQNDSTRALAPLKPAEDAIEFDSTDLGINEVVEKMLILIKEKN